MNDTILAKQIAEAVQKRGGEAFYVGGYVRDLLRNETSKDIDIEVYGIEAEALKELLSEFGEVIYKGKQFGVFQILHSNIDIALPRTEEKIGLKHQDFKIISDPFLDKKKACQRRDFTINALMQNILSGEILDFFKGQEDLKKGVIRHINPIHFKEDPLRVFRAARFSSQLAYEIAEETIDLCSTMDVKDLSKERVLEETNRALLSKKPSNYFNNLRRMKQLKDYYPEIEALINIKQNPNHHLEDAYDHTMMVIDEAIHYRDEAFDARYFMYAALLHDLGKIDAPFHKGHYGWLHEELGLAKIEQFLNRLSTEKGLLNYCKMLCLHHMRPHALFRTKAKEPAILEMMDQCKYSKDLLNLGICDDLSRITKEGVDSKPYIEWAKEANKLYTNFLKRDLIKGEDLFSLGIEEGLRMKEYLERARQLEYRHPKEKVIKILKEDLKCESLNK